MNMMMRILAPLFKLIPLLPNISAFTQQQLETSLREAGFLIEKSWLPGKNKAVFIIAKKQ